jgi:uncharacterized protein YjbI with pentapeptide repeats
MPWRELADLPFAAVLRPVEGPLEPDEDYDCAHFDQVSFDGPTGPNSRFLECAFTGVSVQGGQLRRARFTDVWMREVRLTGTGLAETAWVNTTFTGSVVAGAEAFGCLLRQVVFRGCKLDSVNFRHAVLTGVTFDNCLLRNVDFTGASLTRTSFPQSRLTATDFTGVTLDTVDLRGAELGITVDPGSLRGATVTTAQLADMAALLAEGLGIIVADD